MSFITTIGGWFQSINELGTGSSKDPMRPYYKGKTDQGLVVEVIQAKEKRETYLPTSFCCRVVNETNSTPYVQVHCHQNFPSEPIKAQLFYSANQTVCLPEVNKVISDLCANNERNTRWQSLPTISVSTFDQTYCEPLRATNATPTVVTPSSGLTGTQTGVMTAGVVVASVALVVGISSCVYNAYHYYKHHRNVETENFVPPPVRDVHGHLPPPPPPPYDADAWA